MFSLGTIEFICAVFMALLALVFYLLIKPSSIKLLMSSIFGGIGGIVLLAGFLTPPDVVSNFILSIPASIIFIVIIVVKFIRKSKKE
jgi:Sec-independent protein secretion pathway component TatC